MGRPRSVRLSDVSFSVSHFRSAHALICTVCQSLPVFLCVFCCCFVLLTCSCKHLTAWPISFVGCLDYKPNSKSSVRTLCFSRCHLCFHSLPLSLSLFGLDSWCQSVQSVHFQSLLFCSNESDCGCSHSNEHFSGCLFSLFFFLCVHAQIWFISWFCFFA